MDIRRERHLLVFVLILSVISLSSLPGPQAFEKDKAASSGEVMVRGNSPSIDVPSNEDLLDLKTVLGLKGNGTPEDPIILEGLSIDGSEHGYCLKLYSVNLSLVIRGCSFFNSYSNQSGYPKGTAVWIANCENIAIKECYFFNNSESGVIIYNYIKEISLENNSFNDNLENGVLLDYYDYGWVNISNNRFIGNGENGIRSYDCNYVRIINNRFERNNRGIYFEYSSNEYAFIENNTFVDNEYRSIDLQEYSSHITIKNNSMEGPGISNIVGWLVASIICENNSVNGRPVLLLDSVSNSSITGEYAQIFLELCDNITFNGITVMDESLSLGIRYSSGISISNSSLNGGIEVLSSDVNFDHNDFFDREYGIVMDRYGIGDIPRVHATWNNFFGVSIYGHEGNYYYDFDNINISLDHNFYSELNYRYPYYRSSDGSVWDEPYLIPWTPFKDEHPLVYPVGYDGPRTPTFLFDNTTGYPKMEEVMVFSVDVADFHWIEEVWVRFSFGDGDAQNISLTKEGPTTWSYNVDRCPCVPIVSYSFMAISRAGLTNSTPVKVLSVKDPYEPEFKEDLSPPYATNGESYLFSVVITDNHGIASAWVEYRFNDEGPFNSTLSFDNEYCHEIIVPNDLPGPLFYRFHAVDLMGNHNSTDEVNVTVVDLEDPIAIAGSDIICNEGDEMAFDGSGSSDNVGIRSFIWTLFHWNERIASFDAPSFRFRFDEYGLYYAVLVVKDLSGNSDKDIVNINVGKAHIPAETEEFTLWIGPVKNISGTPLRGTMVIIEIDGTIHSSMTDQNGYVYFHLENAFLGDGITVSLSKAGYSNISYTTNITKDGRLLIDPPLLIPIGPVPIDDDDVDDDLDDDDINDDDVEEMPMLMIITMTSFVLMLMLILVIYIWTRSRRQKRDIDLSEE